MRRVLHIIELNTIWFKRLYLLTRILLQTTAIVLFVNLALLLNSLLNLFQDTSIITGSFLHRIGTKYNYIILAGILIYLIFLVLIKKFLQNKMLKIMKLNSKAFEILDKYYEKQ